MTLDLSAIFADAARECGFAFLWGAAAGTWLCLPLALALGRGLALRSAIIAGVAVVAFLGCDALLATLAWAASLALAGLPRRRDCVRVERRRLAAP